MRFVCGGGGLGRCILTRLPDQIVCPSGRGLAPVLLTRSAHSKLDTSCIMFLLLLCSLVALAAVAAAAAAAVVVAAAADVLCSVPCAVVVPFSFE